MKIFLLIMTLVFTVSANAKQSSYQKYKKFILASEAQASSSAGNVMYTIRDMVEKRTIIVGSCWDYLNAAFTRAGYPTAKRTIVHKGRKNSGPYVAAQKIEAGDWLYYINHSYHDIEHSGLFIGWINYKKKLGLIMSYAGQGRSEPARYRVYDLSHVYHIIRAK